MVTAYPEYVTVLLFGVLLQPTMTLDAEPCGDVGLRVQGYTFIFLVLVGNGAMDPLVGRTVSLLAQ